MTSNTHYRFSHTIIYSEANAAGHLALPAYSSLFQEAALLQAEVLGFGDSYCRREGRMWVLSRLHVKFERLLAHRERISVETWPKAPRGPLAMRDYLIRDEAEGICARATSSWLLLDTATMRPVRPQQVFKEFDFSEAGDALVESAPKVQVAADAVLHSEFTVTARYSDLDAQDHVNNTRYVRWLLDSFSPADLNHREPVEFIINYSRAAAWQEGLRIQRFDHHGTAIVRGLLENDEESFAAELMFRQG